MSGKVRSIKREIQKRAHKEGVLTVTLAKLIESGGQTGALSALINQPIPIGASHEIGKVVRLVNIEMEQYEQSRIVLCERYARKGADGKAVQVDGQGKPITDGHPGTYDIPADKQAEFNSELQQLLSLEVEIAGHPVHVSNLTGARLAPIHSMALDWLIEG